MLDAAQVRGMLGCWLDQRAEAGPLARRLAVAMARAHLRAGHAVIAPPHLGRPEFLETLQAVAAEVGARFVECALLSDRGDVVRRFERRWSPSAQPPTRSGQPTEHDETMRCDQFFA